MMDVYAYEAGQPHQIERKVIGKVIQWIVAIQHIDLLWKWHCHSGWWNLGQLYGKCYRCLVVAKQVNEILLILLFGKNWLHSYRDFVDDVMHRLYLCCDCVSILLLVYIFLGIRFGAQARGVGSEPWPSHRQSAENVVAKGGAMVLKQFFFPPLGVMTRFWFS